MKWIHMADCHLDSELSALFRGEEARERRREILMTFLRAIDYAAKSGVEGFLISGDLFDGDFASGSTVNAVVQAIRENPGIRFFYLKGNHDEVKNIRGFLRDIPENLTVFMGSAPGGASHSGAETVDLGKITVTGIDITSAGSNVYEELTLPEDKINIVLLHGQIRDAFGVNDGENIPLRSLRGKNIDYLALGHIHSHKDGELDERGTYAYSGCPEGRGFDECGEKGFVELEISPETGKVSHIFKPFAKRTLALLSYDISGDESTGEVLSGVAELLREQEVKDGSAVKLCLTGTFNPENEWDPGLLETKFRERFRIFRVKNDTKPRVRYEDYMGEVSLKGEFVRLVSEAPELTEDEKAEIIRCGLSALRGEEPV